MMMMMMIAKTSTRHRFCHWHGFSRLSSSSSSSSSLILTLTWWWWLLLLLLASLPTTVHGILPTAQLTIQVGDSNAGGAIILPYTLLASQASFGPVPPMPSKTDNDYDAIDDDPSYHRLLLPPSNNPLLCQNVTNADTNDDNNNNNRRRFRNSIVIVPRGECTYQFKTWQAQKLGAAGVVLYNTLASRYSINETAHQGEKYPNYSTKDILFPQSKYDYDCKKGSAMIPTIDLSLHPLPYNAQQNDPLLTGDSNDNLCKLHADNNKKNNDWSSTCESHRCLLTSGWNDTDTTVQACCAWDLHLWLYADTTIKDAVKITIPTIFLTMEQGDQVLETIRASEAGENGLFAIVMAKMESRWRSDYNLSSLIIWLLGVFVATLAAYGSAGDYHKVLQKLRLEQRQADNNNNNTNRQAQNNNNRHHNNTPMIRRSPMQEETLELEPIHALGFVIMASCSLLILFYFKIYNVVKVMYAIGCSNAIVQVITYPLVSRFLRNTMGTKPRLIYNSSEFGAITNWDIYAGILGYAWGMTWLYMSLTIPHGADQIPFFWITQNVLGTCMCIVFLGLIQLNSIQVASILLVVAFVYDIFFVFITPYIFQKSIMITVATSGGPPTADPLWCEKYPSDADCQGGDPLPMLLAIPRIWDYQGGASLLGLGDIVLPGLLLSFAARLDAAKALVGMVSGGRSRVQSGTSLECQTGNAGGCCFGCCCCLGSCCKRNGGYYFIPVVIAYAIGLLMANIAVYAMNMGQPALLYLVPCTLGTMAYLGWRRQELRSLWDGPNVLRTADQIVYGTPQQQRQQRQTASSSTRSRSNPTIGGRTIDEEGQDDEPDDGGDDEGDVPLLESSVQGSTRTIT